MLEVAERRAPYLRARPQHRERLDRLVLKLPVRRVLFATWASVAVLSGRR